jgi:hypothetical protein
VDVAAHFYVPNDVESAKVYSHASDRWKEECTTPCTVSLPQGTRVRIVFDGDEANAAETVLEDDGGKTVAVAVRRGGRQRFAYGIALTAVGAAVGGVGANFLRLYAFAPDDTSAEITVGVVMLLTGAAIAGGGVYWMLDGRATKPALERQTFERAPESRVSRLLPATTTPFSLTFAF